MSDQKSPQQLKQAKRQRWRPSTGPIVLVVIILIVAGVALSYVNIPATLSAIQHFFTPPAHLTYSGHSQYVSSVAWSPDGKLIASASGDGTVQVWNALSGRHVFTYRGHQGDVLCVAWSPDGTRIASGGLDHTVHVWDAVTGRLIKTYTGHTDAVFAVAWSPDSKDIASASNDGTMQVWSATTGKRLYSYEEPSARGAPPPWNTVAWSPNGKRIAFGGIGDTVVLDALTGQHISYYGYNGGTVHDVAWSPGGRYLAVASDTQVFVWDILSGKNVYTFMGTSQDIFTLAWSPDGKRIAAGSDDGLIYIWDALTGSHLHLYRGHSDFYPGHYTSNAAVNSLAWSPDGKHIASGSNDNTVQVWPAPTGG